MIAQGGRNGRFVAEGRSARHLAPPHGKQPGAGMSSAPYLLLLSMRLAEKGTLLTQSALHFCGWLLAQPGTT